MSSRIVFSISLGCITCLSFIHSSYFYSASFKTTHSEAHPDTARILFRSFTPKRHRQLRVKDLLKVPTWQLKRDPNPRLFERKATNISMSHPTPHYIIISIFYIALSGITKGVFRKVLWCKTLTPWKKLRTVIKAQKCIEDDQIQWKIYKPFPKMAFWLGTCLYCYCIAVVVAGEVIIFICSNYCF